MDEPTVIFDTEAIRAICALIFGLGVLAFFAFLFWCSYKKDG